MLLGSPFRSEPIDMDGFRTLHVEAWRRRSPDAAPGPATVRILGTEDRDTEKKTWVVKGSNLPFHPGDCVTAKFEEPGRLVRIEAEAPVGVGKSDIAIRFWRY